MLKRIIRCFIKYRIWFFFVACLCFFTAVLYLHGSVYRYVNLINEQKILPKDTRSHGVFAIYIWIAAISLFFSIFAGIPYIFGRNEIKKVETFVFSINLLIYVILITTSLLVLGIFYV